MHLFCLELSSRDGASLLHGALQWQDTEGRNFFLTRQYHMNVRYSANWQGLLALTLCCDMPHVLAAVAPAGFYLDSGTSTAIACPDGTYQPGYSSTSSCTSCAPDTRSYSPRTSSGDCCKCPALGIAVSVQLKQVPDSNCCRTSA